MLAVVGRGLTDEGPRSGRCVAVTGGAADRVAGFGRAADRVAGFGRAADRVAGFGGWWPVRLDKFRMDLVVDPAWRRQGAGGRLLGHVLGRAGAAGAATLQARAASDQAESLAFLLARGFAETMRMHRLVLQLREANLAPHEHLPARLAGQGIVITAMEPELARRRDGWEEFGRLYNAAREGWPDPDPGPVAPVAAAELRRRHLADLQEHGVAPGECFLAVRGDRYVGFTGALGTAVEPAFRGQGVATALKVRAIGYAREHGVATMDTNTGNPAMVAVNEKLGFRLASTEVRLVRPVSGG